MQAKNDTVPVSAFVDVLEQDDLYYDSSSLPTSIHLMRGVIGQKPLWCFEWHICSGCHGHAWSPMKPKDYALPLAAAQQPPGYQRDSFACPCCGKARFKEVMQKNRAKKLQPHLVRTNAHE
jgi:hypothetical protein